MNEETQFPSSDDKESMWISQKKVIIPGESSIAESYSSSSGALDEIVEENASLYYDGKEKNRQNVISLIESAEKELADLKYRKKLMEADFYQMLEYFTDTFVADPPKFYASTIARATLLEYLTFELLKPLESAGLHTSSRDFDTWDTKNFSLSYQLNNLNELEFYFKIKTINNAMKAPILKLLIVSPVTMQARIDDNEVIALLRHCYVDNIYTSGQLSLVNFEMNRILARLKGLGFDVQESLLDNSNPLKLTITSKVEMTEQVIDDIFVTTMTSGDYDFEKLNESQLEIILDKNQTVTINEHEDSGISVNIDTGTINRSILDFYGSYPFLVPLLVQ